MVMTFAVSFLATLVTFPPVLVSGLPHAAVFPVATGSPVACRTNYLYVASLVICAFVVEHDASSARDGLVWTHAGIDEKLDQRMPWSEPLCTSLI